MPRFERDLRAYEPFWYRYKTPLPIIPPLNRIKSLSRKVLQEHKSKFGPSFAANKEALGQVSIISSKGLKNEIAGYITNLIKKELAAAKEKLEQEMILAEQERKEAERLKKEEEERNALAQKATAAVPAEDAQAVSGEDAPAAPAGEATPTKPAEPEQETAAAPDAPGGDAPDPADAEPKGADAAKPAPAVESPAD